MGNALEFWTRGTEAVGLGKAEWVALKATRLAQFVEENDWKNMLILNGVFQLPAELVSGMPRVIACWLRNALATYVMYFGAAFAWVYYAYYVWGNELFKGGASIPSRAAVLEQMKVSCVAIPGYATLPTLAELAIERGFTLVYPRVDGMGVARFAAVFCVYITLVEFGVYWAHRGLHDWATGYRRLHSVHHKYNKENTLSPFASLAFHWLDGWCQGASYCLLLPVVPMHFMTHEVLLFFTGLWTTNIHDCLHARVMPIMGAGYHSIHHTTYKHNYGHYTIYFDALYGTLTHPEDFEGIRALEGLVHEELAKEQGVSADEYQRSQRKGTATPDTARHSADGAERPAVPVAAR